MELFLLKQNVNFGYDTYDSCVVAAESAEAAVQMHPREGSDWGFCSGWAQTPEEVTCEYLGETDHPAGVICASFNAG